MERCPHCRAPLPPPKTCPGCGETFYRGEGGRSDAACCSERCAAKVRKRRQRKRECGRCGSTMCEGCYPAPVEYPGFSLPGPNEEY